MSTRLVVVDGKPQYISEDSHITPVKEVVDEYDCPLCFQSVASSEGEAVDFLTSKAVANIAPYIR